MSRYEERPEWVHCVGLGYQDGRKDESWCEGSDKPFFVDAGHAALNGKHQGRLVACPECVKAINEALCSGHDDVKDDNHE
ncbi:hypothetical protein NVP1251O_05 [Vibrio phage 1.251.O._10N.261.55.E5]|nr:hypothetical protein NVP1251O_05 [Vibrio phage 1.251.O._10N.261.55.E5]